MDGTSLAFVDGLIEYLLKPGNITASVVLVVLVVTLIRGKLIPEDLYKEQRNRADRMEDRAFKATDAMTTAINATEKLADQNDELRRQITFLTKELESARAENDDDDNRSGKGKRA
jgi:hypothetical protein